MNEYAFDTRGLATINVIKPKCLAHLARMRKGEFALAVKAGFEGRKNFSQGERNDFKYQICCV